MPVNDPETDGLLNRAATRDASAADQILMRYRDRLRQMISVRMNPRVRSRFDPSDVIQETLMEATRKLPDYLERRPVPLYPWLRQIAWERLIHLHEKHLETQKRSVRREVRWDCSLPDHSVVELAQRLIASGSSPSHHVLRRELRERVRATLDLMSGHDREILVLWYLEQLSPDEIASILEMTPSGVKSRHRRALVRLADVLSPPSRESE